MDQYWVVGHPIKHSKSPEIHQAFAAQTQQVMEYSKHQLPLDGFEIEIAQFFTLGGQGCNVTVPFKEKAYHYATRLTERARLAGAVNTLKKLENGDILGDNTDGEGLVQDLLNNGVPLKQKRILLLGAGGAVRGVILPLLKQNPAILMIANRTESKAQQLALDFQDYGSITALSLEDCASLQVDVIINATSSGLAGTRPDLSDSVIHPEVTCYDMLYSANSTPFNQWAIECGAKRALDGLGMLVGQAAESFYLWRGVRPLTAPVLSTLRQQL